MNKGFTKIPNHIIELPWGNNPTVVYLYTWLSLHADKDGNVKMSLNEISALTGLNKMQVRRALEKMRVTQVVTQLATQPATQVPNTITICFLSTCKDKKSGTDIACDIASDTASDTHRAYKNDNNISCLKQDDNKTKDSSLRSESKDDFSFDKFWDLYDKKVDRAKVIPLYQKLTLEEKKAIFEFLPKYVQSTPNKKYRKNPQTFLNGKCWNNEIIGDLFSDGTQLRDNGDPHKYDKKFW